MEQLEQKMYEEAQEIIGSHIGSEAELLSKVAYIGFSEDKAKEIIAEEKCVSNSNFVNIAKSWAK